MKDIEILVNEQVKNLVAIKEADVSAIIKDIHNFDVCSNYARSIKTNGKSRNGESF